MSDPAASERKSAHRHVPAGIPDAAVTCPVAVTLSGADGMTSGVCQTLEDAGCPLAVEMQGHEFVTGERIVKCLQCAGEGRSGDESAQFRCDVARVGIGCVLDPSVQPLRKRMPRRRRFGSDGRR